MTASGSYDLPASHRDVAAEIQRLAAQARSGWDKESRTLSWLGLKDGMSVLELGSGPGFITEQLLELVPNSSVTCLEVNPALLTQAEQYLHDKANHRVRFVEGSVMDISLEANQFDCAYARFLFQHLPDPIGAAKEIWRVLKPGGKLVIHDIDDEIFGLFEPPLPGLSLVIEKFGQAQAARGGNRHIGRSLWHILEAAGFHNLDLEVVASHSGNVGVEPFLRQIDPDRMLPLVKMDLMSAQELEQFRVSHTKFLDSPEPYTLWLSLMICGEKP
jgi:ubiquinone/menaquinone biosynthesis C-methylase UbiE